MQTSNMTLITGELNVDHPRYGELLCLIVDYTTSPATCLSLEICPDQQAAEAWFALESLTQPWIVRT